MYQALGMIGKFLKEQKIKPFRMVKRISIFQGIRKFSTECRIELKMSSSPKIHASRKVVGFLFFFCLKAEIRGVG